MPLIGEADYTTQGLIAMDRWLAAVEKDEREVALAQKIREDKPADILDQCTDGAGDTVDPSGRTARAIVRDLRDAAHGRRRVDRHRHEQVPAEAARADGLPPVEFSDDEWGELQTAFPPGSATGRQARRVAVDTMPWMTYKGGPGGQAAGRRRVRRGFDA